MLDEKVAVASVRGSDYRMSHLQQYSYEISGENLSEAVRQTSSRSLTSLLQPAAIGNPTQ